MAVKKSREDKLRQQPFEINGKWVWGYQEIDGISVYADAAALQHYGTILVGIVPIRAIRAYIRKMDSLRRKKDQKK